MSDDKRVSTTQSGEQPAEPKRSQAELHADIERTRAELRATLDAIEFRLNVPKQVRHAVHRTKVRVRAAWERNPALVAGVATGAATAAAALIFVGYRVVRK
ncbi:DUF3618 domain-containing protein [Cnuibacter physcomitrellae]|uniref:DUF3618 domain-containing protein n=1 Tax=Cnuibacter physcomitrellae TaxID=1619308 RepID=UPI00217574E4|nr:DUF3618 domain-containing protein [Cnuibacter physcomitrellae]MCS5497267.1 DUF3618 domain-containing protein [Cnuibacter physcomitrellae]